EHVGPAPHLAPGHTVAGAGQVRNRELQGAIEITHGARGELPWRIDAAIVDPGALPEHVPLAAGATRGITIVGNGSVGPFIATADQRDGAAKGRHRATGRRRRTGPAWSCIRLAAGN